MGPCHHPQRRRHHPGARRHLGVGREHHDHEHKGHDHKILKHKYQARMLHTYPYPARLIVGPVAACDVEVEVIVVESLVFVAVEVAVAVALEIVDEHVTRSGPSRSHQVVLGEARKSRPTKPSVGESRQIHGSVSESPGRQASRRGQWVLGGHLKADPRTVRGHRWHPW